MSSSQSDQDETEPAEPVDAEFEPAPEGAPGPGRASKTDKPGTGAGWFKVSLFVIAAASLGGASGWVAGQVMHAPIFGGGDSALEARLTALESAEPAVTQGELDALQIRIGALEEAQDASGLRADAMEQLVRDAADLRSRVEALENRETATGTDGAGDVDQTALAELEVRMAEAFEEAEARLQRVEEAAATAQQAADEARSAVQQVLSASGSAAGVQDGSNGDGDASALRVTLNALERRQSELSDQVNTLIELSDRVEALENSAASVQSVEQVQTALSALASDFAALERTPEDSQAAGGDARSLAVRALAYADLSQAAAESEPFAAEYAELVRVWPNAPRRADIEALARSGAPTIEDLQASFPGDALRGVTGEFDTYFGVLRVRRSQAEGPSAAIEAALADDDLDTALSLTADLDSEAAAVTEAWRSQALARQRLESALQAMVQALRAEQGNAP